MSESHKRGDDGQSLTVVEEMTLAAAERGLCVLIIQGEDPDEIIVAETPMQIGG